jgi:hypothetical protein
LICILTNFAKSKAFFFFSFFLSWAIFHHPEKRLTITYLALGTKKT